MARKSAAATTAVVTAPPPKRTLEEEIAQFIDKKLAEVQKQQADITRAIADALTLESGVHFAGFASGTIEPAVKREHLILLWQRAQASLKNRGMDGLREYHRTVLDELLTETPGRSGCPWQSAVSLTKHQATRHFYMALANAGL